MQRSGSFHPRRRPTSRRLLTPLLLLAPLAGLAGCGGSSVKVVTDKAPTPTTTSSSATTSSSSSAPTTQSTLTTTRSSTHTTASTTATASSATSTQTTVASVSCGSTAHGFVTGITGNGVTCTTAVQVADTWLAQLQKGLNPAHTVTVTAGETFACTGHFRGSSAAAVLCLHGSGSAPRVAFESHS